MTNFRFSPKMGNDSKLVIVFRAKRLDHGREKADADVRRGA